MRRTHPTGPRGRAIVPGILALVMALALTTGCSSLAGSDDTQEPSAASTLPTLAAVTLTVGDHTTIVTLYDTPASRELLDRMPLTLPVNDVWNQVKWLEIPDGLTTEGTETTTHADNGAITYAESGSMLMLAYIPTDFSSEVYQIGTYDVADKEFIKSIERGTEATLSHG
ncbi:MAG: hypothetical protein E7Z97_09860 [Propionibacteriaceae bacterium]|uniref:Cyclophilin-like domain n=1 Tax=Propionibacterium ruminifibrarum TaxID=1962131 RepID=A0A375I4E9_9ACTN|nr:cyclophilin-like fold protein [Propionibacterium ruminifibrarum]MBE6478350.1 hypothetical protein [Propionibacteriaceae bacterium]SPF68312.1 Cyclophilin-like domain [Propionibacterium ruminifibrarum]